MTLTEQTLARMRSEESYSVVGAFALLVAMLVIPTSDSAAVVKIPLAIPYYKVMESSGSYSSVSIITKLVDAPMHRYQPKTALGKRLIAIREQAIAKGLRLLNSDEIIEEIRRRRGETD